MKKIAIIHTGGTISMVENKQTGVVQQTTEDHPLHASTPLLGKYADVDEYNVFSLPSPQITPKHMLELAKLVEAKLDDYDGFVITHGTDTLEETAYFLDLVLETNKPVVITGAMRSSNEIGSDALYNLISSVRTAIDAESREKGVLVVMNDEVHTASNVTKTATSNIATFQSPQYGPIGLLTKDSVIYKHHPIRSSTLRVEEMNKNVILLKAFAGMDLTFMQAMKNLQPDGLVIEGFGQGNLPKQILPAIQDMLLEKIPIVLVSRCYQGIVQPTYAYAGGGKQLRDMGVIFTNGLTGPKARLKLLTVLETTSNMNEIKYLFEKTY